jgi:hypothetical protein
MDRESKETARQMLGEYKKYVSPMYEKLRAELSGGLGESALALQSLREQEASRQENFALINSFIHTLPKLTNRHDTAYTHDNDAFFVASADPYTAKQIQANVLWVQFHRHSYVSDYSASEPHYIIGRALSSNKKQPTTNLLLASALT